MEYKFAGVVAPGAEECEDAVQCGAGEGFLAGEDPQVFSVLAAHYGIGVVWGKEDDVVVRGKPPEETHPQVAWGAWVGLECTAVYGSCFAVWRCTAVEHLYSAVGEEGIMCMDIYKAALKYVVISGNLVPISHIFFDVKILYSSFVAGLWGNVTCIHCLLFSVKTTVIPNGSASMPQKDNPGNGHRSLQTPCLRG